MCSLWLAVHVRGMCGCVRVGELVEDDCVREKERQTKVREREREREAKKRDIEKE